MYLKIIPAVFGRYCGLVVSRTAVASLSEDPATDSRQGHRLL